MSIFTNFFNETENITAPAVLEGYTFENDADHTIAMETYHDLTKVMEAVHRFDVTGTYFKNVMESASEEDELEEEEVMEAAGKNFFARIKKFFQNLWQRIRSFFSNMVRTFQSYTMNAEDFLKKYEKDIRTKDTDGLKMNLIKFKNISTSSLDGVGNKKADISVTAGEIEKYLKDEESNKKVIDEARGLLLNKGAVEAADFQEELYAYFHDGSDKSDATETDVKVDVAKAIKEIQETKNLAKAVTKANKDIDSTFKDYLKKIDALEKEVNKLDLTKSSGGKVSMGADGENQNTKDNYGEGDKTMQEIRNITSYLQKISTRTGEIQSVNTAFVNSFAKAVKERNSQNMSVLRRVLSYKKKD